MLAAAHCDAAPSATIITGFGIGDFTLNRIVTNSAIKTRDSIIIRIDCAFHFAQISTAEKIFPSADRIIIYSFFCIFRRAAKISIGMLKPLVTSRGRFKRNCHLRVVFKAEYKKLFKHHRLLLFKYKRYFDIKTFLNYNIS